MPLHVCLHKQTCVNLLQEVLGLSKGCFPDAFDLDAWTGCGCALTSAGSRASSSQDGAKGHPFLSSSVFQASCLLSLQNGIFVNSHFTSYWWLWSGMNSCLLSLAHPWVGAPPWWLLTIFLMDFLAFLCSFIFQIHTSFFGSADLNNEALLPLL